MFSPWNSLEVKNLNYKTQAYQIIIKYYRENSCKAIKHQIGSFSSVFFLSPTFVEIKNSFTRTLLTFNSKNFEIICYRKNTDENEPI